MGGSCDVKLVKAAYGQDMNGRTQTAFSGGYLASNMCYITATCYISCAGPEQWTMVSNVAGSYRSPSIQSRVHVWWLS